MKFRKKPVVIEAIKIPQPNDILGHGEVWGFFYRGGFRDFYVADDKGYDIQTLEGKMHGSTGDWIIRGVAGEFYPCRKDIFESTYEVVNEDGGGNTRKGRVGEGAQQEHQEVGEVAADGLVDPGREGDS